MGLAWTSHGGSTLYIETLKQQRRKKIKKDEEEIGSGGIEFTGTFKSLVIVRSKV
jgi:ATP-dependent Lon protease